MGRLRKIADNHVLDAAERVIARNGAAGLSIDAVAKEAGVSKSRVVYDHKSKSALLEALIERRLRRETERTQEAVEACREAPHPELFGRIAAAGREPEQRERAVMLAISTALTGEESLQKRLQAWMREEMAAIERGGDRPRAAVMAYLAVTGLYCTEFFGFCQWGEAERQRLLADIETLFHTFPETPACLRDAAEASLEPGDRLVTA